MAWSYVSITANKSVPSERVSFGHSIEQLVGIVHRGGQRYVEREYLGDQRAVS
jgi:hypothetical protein